MRSTSIARPASALVVASVSLLVGFGATADAATRVSGLAVKRASMPGNRVKPNTLTGIQINEARLGLVPVSKLAQFAELARSAETANSARTAETANTARTAETARVAEDAKKLNGRDHTSFMANGVRTVFNQAAPTVGTAVGVPSEVTASCNADEKAIGGGGAWIITGFQDGNVPSALHLTISASMPDPAVPGVNEATGWRVLGRNLEVGATRSLRAYVSCVPKTA